MSERFPVRIKVYGGSLGILPPGSAWRVERITEHQQASGSIGEPMTEWTIIDFTPLESGAGATGEGEPEGMSVSQEIPMPTDRPATEPRTMREAPMTRIPLDPKGYSVNLSTGTVHAS